MKTVVYLYARVFFAIFLHLFGGIGGKHLLWLCFLSFEEELLYVSEQFQSDLHGCEELSSVLVFPSSMLVLITPGPDKKND